jgi:hypothetical protein
VTILTREHLDAAKSSNGGYSNKQFALIGLQRPIPPGWRKSVVGKEYPDGIIEEFVALKDKHYSPEELKRRMGYTAERKRKLAEKRARQGGVL